MRMHACTRGQICLGKTAANFFVWNKEREKKLRVRWMLFFSISFSLACKYSKKGWGKNRCSFPTLLLPSLFFYDAGDTGVSVNMFREGNCTEMFENLKCQKILNREVALFIVSTFNLSKRSLCEKRPVTLLGNFLWTVTEVKSSLFFQLLERTLKDSSAFYPVDRNVSCTWTTCAFSPLLLLSLSKKVGKPAADSK